MPRIAFFPGSFNPIHTGHLLIAEAVADRYEVDEVWLSVSPQNPFKKNIDLMDDEQRWQMVSMAVEGNDRLKACDIELRLPKPSYTIDTLEALRSTYPNYDFALVIGGDNLMVFDKWKQYQDILDKHGLYVYPREGMGRCELLAHPRVTMLEVPRIDISSTLIREKLANGKSVRYMVPDSVYDYLNQRCSV